MSNENKDFEFLSGLEVYRTASVPDRVVMILDMKHHSLESGADAHVELFNRLMPELIRLARIGLWAKEYATPLLYCNDLVTEVFDDFRIKSIERCGTCSACVALDALPKDIVKFPNGSQVEFSSTPSDDPIK